MHESNHSGYKLNYYFIRFDLERIGTMRFELHKRLLVHPWGLSEFYIIKLFAPSFTTLIFDTSSIRGPNKGECTNKCNTAKRPLRASSCSWHGIRAQYGPPPRHPIRAAGRLGQESLRHPDEVFLALPHTGHHVETQCGQHADTADPLTRYGRLQQVLQLCPFDTSIQATGQWRKGSCDACFLPWVKSLIRRVKTTRPCPEKRNK